MLPTRDRILKIIVNAARLTLGAVFVFSGFVKAIDPYGTALKIHEYARAVGIGLQSDNFLFAIPALLLLTVEFWLGALLLLGIRRKIATIGTLLLMLVMTAITLYIALTGKVQECGCFGDAIVLSNWATVWKNIVLLICAVLCAVRPNLILRLVNRNFQWIPPLYTVVFILAYAIYNYTHLPLIDFRPYKTGTDLARLHDEPGTDGTFVEAAFYDHETFDDITDSVLSSGTTLLLISPRIEAADQDDAAIINEVYDYAKEQGYAFYGVTASTEEHINTWRDYTGAEYPFVFGDDKMLQTMIRSNPGIIVLHDGIIANKYHHSRIPYEPKEVFSAATLRPSVIRVVSYAVLWYIIPLFIVFLFDKYVFGISEKLLSKRNKSKTVTKMRKNIVAGNWKMNKTLQEGIALATEINAALAADKPNCDVVICTPFIHLASVTPIVDAAIVGVGAENCADKASGAYTGEVSAEMVKSTGAQYVILGHSERRAYYGETAEILKAKVQLALENGLTPIFCIGEVLEEREAGKQNEVVSAQLEGSLFDLSAADFSKIVIAYEPVWAIGTGKTATAEQAQEIHAYIRSIIAEKYGKEVADNTSILYGGSCKPSNAKELFDNPDVDGGLIGGAALTVADFKGIIDAFK